MAQMQQTSAADALNWNTAESNIDRFNKNMPVMEPTTYGFKGFPENYMFKPKLPLRHQPSADVHTDVNRYFRKDSPTEWMPPAQQQRMPSPPPQREPEQKEWLQSKKGPSPPPPAPVQQHVNHTISPRYADEPPSFRKPPIIRDPFRQLTSAERRKKVDEHFQAEEDLAISRRRKEQEKYEKIEEQQRMRYGDDSGIDRVRTSMEQRHDMPERREDFGRAATMPPRTSYSDQQRNIPEMVQSNTETVRKLQEEIDRLKQYHQPWEPRHDHQDDNVDRYAPRAHSGHGYSEDFEPQTDRTWKRFNRDREIFGQTHQNIPDYLNVSPRRRPAHTVGQMYNKESTYTTDYDVPFGRQGRRILSNPNKEPYEPFNPFGADGGGAPQVDASGQRKTRIVGTMNRLGREASDSAKARASHNLTLLHEIGQQAANERLRRQAEKAQAKEGFVELADHMRSQKVGYPKYEPSGYISHRQHLPHMFNTYSTPALQQQREYHDFLTNQVQEKHKNTRLGQLEEKRQAREHFRTQDSFFGKRGGGNIKGDNLRKCNLDRAIHNPQSTMVNYM